MIDFQSWTIDKAIETAREIGLSHGEVAGNGANIADILRYEINNDFDDEWYNPWPEPDLSGEWADNFSLNDLYEHCDIDELEDDRESIEYEVITAYELAFAEASEDVINNRMNYS